MFILHRAFMFNRLQSLLNIDTKNNIHQIYKKETKLLLMDDSWNEKDCC